MNYINNKVKILAVTPYEGMREIMLDAASQRNDIDLAVFVGDLTTGVNIAKEAVSKADYDIIISRGGTAEMISKTIDIPLLEVPISIGDILQAIKLAQNYHEKFAIVGFSGITNYANLICSLLQYEINVYTIHHVDEVPVLLERLKQEGYTMVLCDMIASTVARQIGLNAVLIMSGSESIENVFNQAVKVCHIYSEVKNKAMLFESALKHNLLDIIIYKESGEMLFSSLENNKKNKPIFSLLKSSFHHFLNNDTYCIRKQMDGKIISVNVKKATVCKEATVMVYLKMTEKMPAFEYGGMRFWNKNEYESEQFSDYNITINSIGNTRTVIEQYSLSSLPVMITGETGTGKDAAASFLYVNGPYQSSPCCVIDCGIISEKHWNSLLKKPLSSFNDIDSTIYFKNVGKLTDTQFNALCQLIECSNLSKRNRIIFSFVTNGEQNEQNKIYNYLTNTVSCLVLNLLPLRLRTKDLPGLSALYINQLNFQLGKQIIGFEPDALSLIQNYYWPQNLYQFKRILKELVIITDNFYITKENVASCLKKEEEVLGLSSVPPKYNLNINQSLDKINYDIIRAVLSEEKNNQKKAAQRLGISRSTIWRILKTRLES